MAQFKTSKCRKLHRSAIPVALVGISAAIGCWRSPEETSETLGATTIAPWSKPAPASSSAVSPVAERAAYAPPSTMENMGRNFQGRMEFKVSVAGQPDRTLRYMSQGNASRLQISSSKTRTSTPPTILRRKRRQSLSKQTESFSLALMPLRKGTLAHQHVSSICVAERCCPDSSTRTNICRALAFAR